MCELLNHRRGRRTTLSRSEPRAAPIGRERRRRRRLCTTSLLYRCAPGSDIELPVGHRKKPHQPRRPLTAAPGRPPDPVRLLAPRTHTLFLCVCVCVCVCAIDVRFLACPDADSVAAAAANGRRPAKKSTTAVEHRADFFSSLDAAFGCNRV